MNYDARIIFELLHLIILCFGVHGLIKFLARVVKDALKG